MPTRPCHSGGVTSATRTPRRFLHSTSGALRRSCFGNWHFPSLPIFGCNIESKSQANCNDPYESKLYCNSRQRISLNCKISLPDGIGPADKSERCSPMSSGIAAPPRRATGSSFFVLPRYDSIFPGAPQPDGAATSSAKPAWFPCRYRADQAAGRHRRVGRSIRWHSIGRVALD